MRPVAAWALAAGVLAALVAGAPSRAQEPEAASPDDMAPAARRAAALEDERLPGATSIDKITWTTSEGVTRLRFAGRRIPEPAVVLAHPEQIRIDVSAASVATLPRTLQVGTPQVRAIRRLPEGLAGVLPEGVSARFFVQLAVPDLAWSVESDADGFSLFVGVQEKAGRREVLFDDDSWYAGVVRPGADGDVLPEPGERLVAAVPVTVRADQPVRSGPSAVHPETARVAMGEVRVVDARRGEWAHLAGGGWIRHDFDAPAPQLPGSQPEAPPAPAPAAERTPVEFTVVTLATGLAISFEEVLPGDAEGLRTAAAFRDPLRLARLEVKVAPGTHYEFYLPPKKGRVRLELRDGRVVESLDPTALPLRDPAARAVIDESFAAEPLMGGDTWSVLLPLPADLDFLDVAIARVDVGGQLNRLFRVPGSGEVPPQAP